jgi:hypothetical protein
MRKPSQLGNQSKRDPVSIPDPSDPPVTRLIRVIPCRSETDLDPRDSASIRDLSDPRDPASIGDLSDPRDSASIRDLSDPRDPRVDR